MLKDLLKIRSQAREAYVVPVLEQQVLVEGTRSRLERKRGVFHPSEISGDFCPREWLLCDRNRHLYLDGKITVNTQLRWDVGSALHDMVQSKLGNAGVLFGEWSCLRRCSGRKCKWIGFKPVDECVVGEEFGVSPLWKFDEVEVKDDELEIEGRSDGLLDIRGGKFALEFKTMYNDGFSTLIDPLDWHKEQGAWYLEILEDHQRGLEQLFMDLASRGEDVTKELEFVRRPFTGILFLYMNKDSQQLREFRMAEGKEFVVGKNDKIFELIRKKKEVLRETLKHRDSGTLPERICFSKDERRARKCLAKSICFEED